MAQYYLGSTPTNQFYLGNTKINDTADYLSFISASGGTIETSGSFKIHTFTASADFTVTRGGRASDVFIVAGGGGGGNATTIISAGGGGAGGVVLSNNFDFSIGTFPVVVGAGGAIQQNGQTSSLAGLVALGGGAGGGSVDGSAVPALNGGSGGGANTFDDIVGIGLQPTASTAGFGNDGVLGGGGASNTGSSDILGTGGDGILFRGVYYAGGGGAGTARTFSEENGGLGEGGRGGAFFSSTAYTAAPGDNGFGAGGGGGLANSIAQPVGGALRTGAVGGSGVVKIVYQFQP